MAFARNYGKRWAVIVVPRFLTALISEGEIPLGEEIWEDTQILLPKGVSTEKEFLTDMQIDAKGKILVGKAFQYFPASIIVGAES